LHTDRGEEETLKEVEKKEKRIFIPNSNWFDAELKSGGC